MGDFNVVLGAHERSSGARNPARPSQEFIAFLDEAHQHDMDTSGPQFTWYTTASSPIQLVTQKLKRLKATLKKWNQVTFRNIYVEMEEASEALNTIQAESALYGDSDDRLLVEIDCTVRLNAVLNQHQINSTQWNHLQWLQDGDCNSRFFHTMNRIRKTPIGLSSLVVDGELTFDLGIISDTVVQFYTELFTAHDQDTYDDNILGEFIHPVVDTVDNSTLIALPSVEEIKRVVFDMEPSSSPSPDVFGGSFYQACWDIIAFDVIEEVKYFFTTSFIPFGLNSSFVTLIRKKPGANRVEDFWPIVMGNYLFKIFTKIIVSRLGGITTRILSPFQFGSSDIALLHGRYISVEGKPRNSGRPSSIGPGIRRHLGRLVVDSRWVVGHSSGISFWNDNWLGYIISERIGIHPSFIVGMSSTIRDYFYDEHWHFDYDFFMKHTDIVRDILSIHISKGSNSRVWGNSVSGQLTSRMAYAILRSPNPRVNWSSWI
ncbi:hypothetical protein ACS0TY_003543 [Phlomoides rotata]